MACSRSGSLMVRSPTLATEPAGALPPNGSFTPVMAKATRINPNRASTGQLVSERRKNASIENP